MQLKLYILNHKIWKFKHKIAIFQFTQKKSQKIQTFYYCLGFNGLMFKIYETKIRNSFKHCSYAVFSFCLFKISTNKKKSFDFFFYIK